MNSMTELILQLKNVSKKYVGLTALHPSDLDLYSGEILVILGSNGAGKSTLLKLMCGAESSDSGEVIFLGAQQKHWSIATSRSLGVEVVHQELAVVGELNPIENLYLGRELVVHKRWWPFLARRVMRKEGSDLLRSLGAQLSSLKGKTVELSGGQRQAVAIARAVGWGEKLIILDEPTAALGIAETAEVEQMIRTLRGRGLAVVLVTHRLDQAKNLADRVAVVRQGRIVGNFLKADIEVGKLAILITGEESTSVV
jgi:ABC-type sugar transport system ATPase subunit